jgi:transcriptional regulator with XRE-family HTH domain
MSTRDLSVALEARRIEKGWTQRDLSISSGVSLATISAIERSSRDRFQTTTLQSLDRALGWPLGTAQALQADTDLPDSAVPVVQVVSDHTVRTLLDVVTTLSDDAVRQLIVTAQRLSSHEPEVARIEGVVVDSHRIESRQQTADLITIDTADGRWLVTCYMRRDEHRPPTETDGLAAGDGVLIVAQRI